MDELRALATVLRMLEIAPVCKYGIAWRFLCIWFVCFLARIVKVRPGSLLLNADLASTAMKMCVSHLQLRSRPPSCAVCSFSGLRDVVFLFMPF